jgi:transposase
MLKHKKPYESKQADYSYFEEIKKKLVYTKMKDFLTIVLAA